MNAPQEEEFFGPTMLKIFENYLTSIRHSNSDEKVEQLIKEALRDLPVSLKAGYDPFELIEIKSFLQILLQKFIEGKADSKTLIKLTLDQYKDNKRALETAMLARKNQPRRSSTKYNTGSRGGLAQRSSSHLLDLAQMGTDSSKTPLNTATTDVRNRKSLLLSAQSASGNPAPQSAPENSTAPSASGNPAPPSASENPAASSPRQDTPTIKVNLYSNTASIKSWFVNYMSNTSGSDFFTIPVKMNHVVHSLDVSLKQDRPEPDIIIALCDKEEAHTELLKQLVLLKDVPIVFIRTNIKNCSSPHDISKGKLEKCKIDAFFYEIEFGKKDVPATVLRQIVEKIPVLLSEDKAEKPEKKDACALM